MKVITVIVALLATLLTLPAWAEVDAAPGAKEPRYSYRFRDRIIPIELDTSRVFFLRAGDVPLLTPSLEAGEAWTRAKEHSPEAAPELGIDPQTVKPNDSVRMWELNILDRKLDADGVEQLVSKLVEQPWVAYAGPAFQSNEDRSPMLLTGDFVVRFNKGIDEKHARAVIDQLDIGRFMDFGYASMPGLTRVEPTKPNGFHIIEAVRRCSTHPSVDFAEPGWVLRGEQDVIPNDAGFGLQWGLRNTGQSGGFNDVDIDAPEAWDTALGSGITVLVLDVGVQRDHPDLNYDIRFGQNFRTSPPSGDGGPIGALDNHGTSVAGVISGRFNNMIGVAGTAPASFVVSARIGDALPGNAIDLTAQSVASAISYAADVGARVTNSSFRMTFAGVVEAAYEDMWSLGIINIAASGNSHPAPIVFPASSPWVLATGAIDRTGLVAESSCRGFDLDFVAPGVDIYTTDRTGCAGYTCQGGNNDYTISADGSGINGTSFACPHAAGVAALILGRNPRLSPDQVTNIFKQTAFDISPQVYGFGVDDSTGWGLINAAAALGSTPQARLGDANGDGSVNFSDISSVLANFGAMSSYQGDADLNGIVGFPDITSVLANYD